MTAKIPEKYAVIQSHLMLFSHRTNISSGRKYQKFNEEVMVDSSPQDNSPPTLSTLNTIQPMTPSPKLFRLLATQIKTIHPQTYHPKNRWEMLGWIVLGWTVGKSFNNTVSYGTPHEMRMNWNKEMIPFGICCCCYCSSVSLLYQKDNSIEKSLNDGFVWRTYKYRWMKN